MSNLNDSDTAHALHTKWLLAKNDPGAGAVHVDSATWPAPKKPKKPPLAKLLFKLWAGAPRALRPCGDGTNCHPPIPYDPQAFHKVRPDQAPRFFAALTDKSTLPKQELKIADLVAMQDRVDGAKVEAMRGKATGTPVAVKLQAGSKWHVADGHHRVASAWLDGANTIEMHVKDLSAMSRAVKSEGGDMGERVSFGFKIDKVDEEKRIVYGWASVIEEAGVPVVDKQDDVIDEETLVNAADDFMANVRELGDMHTRTKGLGTFVHSMVFTKAIQAALGIDLKKVGWFVGVKVADEGVWQRVKSGELAAFSIGGYATREDMAG